MKSSLEVRATMVADEFIDRYMPSANGEYVKVYLYLLRHQDRQVTVLEMADALDHTESDIRRALTYWTRLGVLVKDGDESGKRSPDAVKMVSGDDLPEKRRQKPGTAADGDEAAAVVRPAARGAAAASDAGAGQRTAAAIDADSDPESGAAFDTGAGQRIAAESGVRVSAGQMAAAASGTGAVQRTDVVSGTRISAGQMTITASGTGAGPKIAAAFDARTDLESGAAFDAGAGPEMGAAFDTGAGPEMAAAIDAGADPESGAAFDTGAGQRIAAESGVRVSAGQGAAALKEEKGPEAAAPAMNAVPERKMYTPEQVKKLSQEEDFTQLLYVAQKYLNKVFTPRECEVFAYLYDGLKMPAELLEYLVEYCVQGNHTAIRYLETVALNWHEKGINTVECAKKYTSSYSSEAFAVMRAFGLSDRRPGNTETEMIHRWFHEWGFTKELVLAACGRTLTATSKPSFAYTDRILMEWKKAGVRTMADVQKLDEQRERQRAAAGQSGHGTDAAGQQASLAAGAAAVLDGQGAVRTSGQQASRPAAAGGKQPGRGAGSRNRFHNFDQRDTNYDAMALKQLKERLGEK